MPDDSKRTLFSSRTFWQRLLVIGLLLLIIGGAASILLFRASSHNAGGVRYNGRTLESYLSDLNLPTSMAQYATAKDAVLKLGDRALPGLQDILDRGVPWPARWFERYQSKLPGTTRNWINREFDPFKYRKQIRGALNAVGILGTNAAPLAATLSRRFARDDYQTRVSTAQVLPRLGAAMVPVMRPFLTDPDLRTRGLAAFCFYQLGPEGADAADALVAGLDGADANHKRLVAQTLDRMGARALPVITNLLQSVDASRRSIGLQAMDGMFPRLLELTPMIIGCLNDPDPEVRLRAALLVGEWWPQPVSILFDKLKALPATNSSRVRFTASIEALESHAEKLRVVLREGLRADVKLRLRAAKQLVDAGDVDRHLIASLEELATNPNATGAQLSRVNALLKKAREKLATGRRPESDRDPRTVEAAQSPPSNDPPPPGK